MCYKLASYTNSYTSGLSMSLNLSMKHVQIDQNGNYRYRRRVPEYAKAFVGKREFVKVIGKTENDALSHYGQTHRHCNQLFALAREGVIDSSPQVQQERLEVLLRNMGADPHSSGLNDNEQIWRDVHADRILNKYKRNLETGRYIDVSKEDEASVGALLSGVSKEKPEPTITDAFKFYLKEHPMGDDFKRKKQEQRLGRVERWLLKTVREDKPLSKVNKSDARELRDARRESGVSVGTIKREFNDIRAVFNFARSELEVTMNNPFVGLLMPTEEEADREKIKPLDLDVIQGVYSDLQEWKVLLQIWTLLDLTGARLAEIAGLRRNEFILGDNIPHINIQPSAGRTLKTKWSRRTVPLVKEALNIAREIVSKGSPEDYAFGKYGPVKAHDNLGSALRKRIRKHTSDPKHVTHSLRHNMKDRLRDAEVFPETAKSIQGHALSKGQDASYGSGISLDKKLEALLKANP